MEGPYVLLAVLSLVAIGALVAAAWLGVRLRRVQALHAAPAPGSQQKHDVLTGLPTRVAIVASAEHTIAEAQQAKVPFAVTVLNVSRFKSINDSLGHEVGDELPSVSQRLRAVLANGDILGRLAGDSSCWAASARARFLRGDGRDDFRGAAQRLDRRSTSKSRFCAGISMFAANGTTFGTPVATGETAMRAAQHRARQFRFYSEEMSKSEEASRARSRLAARDPRGRSNCTIGEGRRRERSRTQRGSAAALEARLLPNVFIRSRRNRPVRRSASGCYGACADACVARLRIPPLRASP
jgi:diguanylate cyclase (GGDEF)-like protein